ncbi:hypothetical protein FIBSPDRAFT_961727 [Athelia psychrophila]|uniref:Uncharacterized protein n=1 Tax=Athelia psychrophila TaxID=1759441 RepID=A0A166AWY6_9AGAM|nr:hypothetical protein FIBSPDRAFT_961727 [Fibularhizoctonia sp. CBS 109695]
MQPILICARPGQPYTRSAAARRPTFALTQTHPHVRAAPTRKFVYARLEQARPHARSTRPCCKHARIRTSGKCALAPAPSQTLSDHMLFPFPQLTCTATSALHLKWAIGYI